MLITIDSGGADSLDFIDVLLLTDFLDLTDGVNRDLGVAGSLSKIVVVGFTELLVKRETD